MDKTTDNIAKIIIRLRNLRSSSIAYQMQEGETEFFADYMLQTLENLQMAESNFHLPGGTLYSTVMKRSVSNVKRLLKTGMISQSLANEMLESLATKINEAVETFKRFTHGN